jgi:hypothetical protein
MSAPQSGSPMTYMLNGKQYVVVAISGGTYSGELVAYDSLTEIRSAIVRLKPDTTMTRAPVVVSASRRTESSKTSEIHGFSP